MSKLKEAKGRVKRTPDHLLRRRLEETVKDVYKALGRASLYSSAAISDQAQAHQEAADFLYDFAHVMYAQSHECFPKPIRPSLAMPATSSNSFRGR